MDVPVVVEKTSEGGYRASAFTPAPLVAEAVTREKAVDTIRELIRKRFAEVEVIHVEVPDTSRANDPWLAMAGTWCDIDTTAFEQNIRDYRREVDEDDSRL